MKTKPAFISDAQLERRASEQGRSSAEAYVLLELREARSAGDEVSAFVVHGHYTVKSTPNLSTVPTPSDASLSQPYGEQQGFHVAEAFASAPQVAVAKRDTQ